MIVVLPPKLQTSSAGSAPGPVAAPHQFLAAFTLVYAFVCFRVLDVFKPWPAWRLQRVPAGWGIVLDDLIAGLYAAIAVQALTRTML